jgi:hypothetical protein
VFVDVTPVSAVLYIINFANCYQNGPKKLEKKLRKEEKEESNPNRKEEGNCAEIWCFW